MRFGHELTFPQAYRFIVEEDVPAGQDRHSAVAMQRLYRKVIALPTIADSTAEILQVIARFKRVLHWHGSDGRWLKKLGSTTPSINLGHMYNRFMMPVKKYMDDNHVLYGATQEIACVAVGGTWKSPHFSQNDAEMLDATSQGLVKLVLD